MAKGSKTKYSDKQKRQAQHIEQSYEEKGLSQKLAKMRAWQTVNKQSGGGEKTGGGVSTSSKSKTKARRDSGKRAASSRRVGTVKVQKVKGFRASKSR